MAKMAQIYYEKLEKMEQEAYDGGYGADWLSDIGEGLKWYAYQCSVDGTTPTFAGFMNYIERKWKGKS